MPYGSSLGVSAPTVSVTAGPTYATEINAYLEALRTVVEAKVTPAGFSMTTDLTFASGSDNFSAVDLLSTEYAVQTSALDATAHPGAVYFSGVNGDLYVNDAAGNQIQITASGALNSAATSGITGSGYGTGGVAVNWSSADQGYQFLAGASTYADVICDDLKLNDGDTNFISVVSPALAADYTITLPNAVPGSNNTLMTMATTGTVSNTGTPTVTSLTTTGTLSVGTTSTFTGKPTFTVEYARPARTRHILAIEAMGNNVGGATTLGFGTGSDPSWTFGDSTHVVLCPIHLEEGEVLQSVTWLVTHGDSASARTYDVGYWNDGAGAWTYPGGGNATTSSTVSAGQQVVLSGLSITGTNPHASGTNVGFLMARMQGKYNTTGDVFWGLRVTTQRT